MAKHTEKQIMALRKLGLTEQEIAETLADDDKIDKGETCDWEVPMTPEQKKLIRQLRGTERKVGTTKVKREKKTDDNKKAIMELLRETIANDDNATDIAITNPEREMTFNFNGVAYKVVLSAPRTAKAD